MSTATDPDKILQDAFGVGTFQPDLEALAEEYDPTPDPYMGDPVGFVEDVLGEYPWSVQREILESVRDNRYTVVQSAHDTGKSYIAARAVAWWLSIWPIGEAFAVTTAPTWPQVRAILWREIRKAHKKGKLDGRLTLNAEWYMGGRGVPGDADEELVAYGRKPADQDQAAFQGIHAKYVLVVIDEASGVPKNLYDAVDTLATNAAARVLAIGNPDDPASQMEKVCRPGSGWNNITVSAFDTPAFTDEEVPEELHQVLVSPEWVEERKRRWGEESPIYVSKVLGRFPDISDDTLISPAMLRLAVETDLIGKERGSYGGDVARYGDDETCLYRNRGGVIREVESHHKKDTEETADMFAKHVRPHNGAVPIAVDADGLGAGVYDKLKRKRLPVREFRNGQKPIDQKRFVNRKAECYWNLREDMEAGEVDLDPLDEDLLAQLGSIKWGLDSKGRIYIESKDDMRKRGLPSPDRADAAMMAHAASAKVWPRELVPDARPRTPKSLTHNLRRREL